MFPSYKIIHTKLVNSYLLKAKQGYLLIDTGYPNQYQNFLAKLRSENISLSDIKYLLLTHHHNDHSGFAQKILSENKAELIVHEQALPFLRSGSNEKNCYSFNWLVKLLRSSIDKLGWTKYQPLVLKDKLHIIREEKSEYLRSLGIEATILYTPGHTQDSISIILSDNKAIVGDLVMPLWGDSILPLFIQDLDTLYVSWQKLLDNNVKEILPTHGKSIKSSRLKEALIKK